MNSISATNEDRKHCQICGRAIKAKVGIIAHHGYTRPGDGWQTESCPGARYRPYEVACDALPPAIKSCTDFIINQEIKLLGWVTSPPTEISHQRRDAYGKPVGPEMKFARPLEFDGEAAKDNYLQNTYVFHFVRTRSGFKRRIESSKETLRYLERRLADWRDLSVV